jgi:predicted DNA-binding protein
MRLYKRGTLAKNVGRTKAVIVVIYIYHSIYKMACIALAHIHNTNVQSYENKSINTNILQQLGGVTAIEGDLSTVAEQKSHHDTLQSRKNVCYLDGSKVKS